MLPGPEAVESAPAKPSRRYQMFDLTRSTGNEIKVGASGSCISLHGYFNL